jgi:hypothetical protein
VKSLLFAMKKGARRALDIFPPSSITRGFIKERNLTFVPLKVVARLSGLRFKSPIQIQIFRKRKKKKRKEKRKKKEK